MQPPSDDFTTGYVPDAGPSSLATAVGIALLLVNLGVAALMLVMINLE